MFLRPKESLRLSIYSLRRCIGFSQSRYFHLTPNALLRNISGGRRKAAEVRDCESSPSVAGELSVCVPPKKVNDNFYGIESDEGVIVVNSKPSLNNNATRRLFKNVEQEKLVTTSFGTVRYDSENKPKNHGQLEKETVLISSHVNKDKIYELNQALLKKNSAKNHGVLSGTERSSKKTTDILDRNLNSKAPSISYVDELYFSESYTEKETNTISKSEGSSSNYDKSNFIEESYFSDKIPSESHFNNDNITSGNQALLEKNSAKNHGVLSGTERSSKKTTDILDRNLNSKAPSISYVDELYFSESYTEKETNTISKSEGSSSNYDKSNFIEESYFSDKIPSESHFNNDITSENICSTDKIYSLPEHKVTTESNVDHKLSSSENTPGLKSSPSSSIDKSNSIEECYFRNEMADESIYKNVNMASENISNNDENHLFLVPEKPTEYIADDEPSALYNLDTNIEKINVDENGNQLSLEWNNLSVEELSGYNKFISSATDLPKKKNNFSFQSKEFLKKSEFIESESLSRVNRLRSFQKKVYETDTTEKLLDEKEIVTNPQKTQDSKVKKEADMENSNSNEQPETAYDFVNKLRSTKKKLDPELINGKFIQKTEQYDSKGFRVLKNQVPDLKFYTKDEILDLLVKNVLYSDDDVIVLNKPYNLVMHESKTAKDPCLSQYLNDLAAELDKKTHKPKLITVHRLDKETSGCLLLARNEISAQRLLSLFAQRKIIKTYWIVTTRVPEPLEGVIDMPISEGSIDGRSRMVLHPDLPKDIPYQNHSRSGKRAVTYYKVIAESGNAALVEAKPETGIKHQIRVHFGFGLSCPILGDHKYSHLDKLAPQKLQADLLQRLLVRQSKVRHIPMHIYARSIFIPQYKDGRNLFAMAPMPIHMSKNLQKLKFKK